MRCQYIEYCRSCTTFQLELNYHATAMFVQDCAVWQGNATQSRWWYERTFKNYITYVYQIIITGLSYAMPKIKWILYHARPHSANYDIASIQSFRIAPTNVGKGRGLTHSRNVGLYCICWVGNISVGYRLFTLLLKILFKHYVQG